jgi:hypothetical protein
MKQRRSVEGEFRIYVGVDWGTEFHRACVLDSSRKILRQCRVDHNGQAITDFLRSLYKLANGQPATIAMAIKVPQSPVVEPSWREDTPCSRSILRW